jgi:S1-C subfamily serine protease
LASSLPVALLLASSAGCRVPAPTQAGSRLATPAAEGAGVERPFEPPIALASDPREDAIVRIVGPVACSGVLVDDDLVLTAHHCVASRDGRGAVRRADLDPHEVRVELGGDDLPWGEVGVRAIVSPACGFSSGDGDIALLVLERKLPGMPFADVRMHEPPDVGEHVAPWGFGRCSASRGAIRRHGRDGRAVSAVTGGQIVADASICPGDSGGPVFSDQRDVIGVVSASVMDNDPATLAPSLFTRVDVWTALFSAARAIGDGASASELPPFRGCHAQR